MMPNIFIGDIQDSYVMTYSDRTTIPCEKPTREELKSLKRGGENWDSLLRKLSESYDPEDMNR